MSERTELLRILLADQDDANAFLFQCGVNRLGRPCAFHRVALRDHLPEKLQSFRPDLLIAAGDFARPGELRQIKELTNGHPIICAVESHEEGEAAIAAGATDCVLVSQVDELHACIEHQLSGTSNTPYFRKGLRQTPSGPAEKLPSKLDLKLEEFDRRVGAWLKQIARATQVKSRKLARVSRAAWLAVDRELQKRYKALKVQWLLHKQKRLIKSNFSQARLKEASFGECAERNASADTLSNFAPHPSGEPHEKTEPATVRIVSVPKPKPAPATADAAPAEEADHTTLRTLELSFKTLFHTSLDPMFLLDGLGSFLHANAPACALLGVAPADLLGKSLLDFVPAHERPQVSAMWEALLIEGQQKTEMRFQPATGDLREVLISARSNLWFGVHLLIARDRTELNSLRNAVRAREQAA
jgi:PAS domain S-box-containing protein